MTRARPRFTPRPRIWNEFQVATRLNMSEPKFKQRRPELEAQGFPKYDDFLGGRDADAIEAWLNKRSGLTDSTLADADKDLESWRP